MYRAAISELGYDVKIHSGAQSEKAVSRRLSRLYVPTDAPTFFVDAIERAKAKQRPLVIDFWAEWCVACLRLKRETLENTEVAQALRSVELIYVDLDKYPSLGDAYGVAAIPDLIFADKSGRIVDRLQTFEGPEDFVGRLRRVFIVP